MIHWTSGGLYHVIALRLCPAAEGSLIYNRYSVKQTNTWRCARVINKLWRKRGALYKWFVALYYSLIAVFVLVETTRNDTSSLVYTSLFASGGVSRNSVGGGVVFHPHYAVPYPFHYELIYVAKREENTRIADLFVLYNLSAFHQYAKLVKQIFMALGPTSASSSLLRIRLFLLRIRSEKNMEFYIHHLNFLNFYVSNRICIRNRATFFN